MSEPSTCLAEASDMELVRTKKGAGLVAGDSLQSKPDPPPSECWHALGFSVFAAAMLYRSQIILLPHRRLDTGVFIL